MPDRAMQSRHSGWLSPSLFILLERLRDADEAELLRAIKFVAEQKGWLFYHTQDSRRCEPGFPDCVLVKRGKVLLVELKRQGGRLRPEQKLWLEELGCRFDGNKQRAYGLASAVSFVVTPENVEDLLTILSTKEVQPREH